MKKGVKVAQQGELLVINKAKTLCKYIIDATGKSPKKFRFTLVTRLQNYSLDVVESLITANEIYVVEGASVEAIKRTELQRKAMTSLKLISYISEIAMTEQCILPRQFEQISKLIFNTQNLLGAWMKSDRNKFKNMG